MQTKTGFARVNGAQLYYEVAGAGHMLNMEKPALFNQKVVTFLSSLPPAA